MITRKSGCLKQAIFLCKEFNVKYRFIIDKRSRPSYADCRVNRIVVNIPEYYSADQFLGTVFHEISHILLYRKNVYKKYCLGNMYQVRKIGLLAEIYTDKYAEKLFKTYYPKRKYRRAYRTKRDRTWYKNYINQF